MLTHLKFLWLLSLLGLSASLTWAQSQPNIPDRQPLYSGRDDPLSSQAQQEDCSSKQVMAFVREHLVYPEAAKAEGIEGLVVLKYLIDEEGQITYVQTLRDPGKGCGEAAMAVIRQLPKFSPGLKDQKPVAVEQQLALRFELRPPEGPDQGLDLLWNGLYLSQIRNKTQISQELYRGLLTVRDAQGQVYPIEYLELGYVSPREKIYTEREKGANFSPRMQKLLKHKIKPGGTLLLTVRIQKGFEVVEIYRELPLID